MPTQDWWKGLFAAVDAKDTAAFIGYLTADAEFRFGNAPAARGREAIAAAVAGFFASIGGSRHRLVRTFDGGNSCACQGEVTYTRHDGSTLTLPFVNVFGMRDGLIAEYLIFIDIAPLYAA